MPFTYQWKPESKPVTAQSTVRIRTWDNKAVTGASYTITPPVVNLTVPTQNRYTIQVRTDGHTETAHLNIPEAQNSTSLEERIRKLVEDQSTTDTSLYAPALVDGKKPLRQTDVFYNVVTDFGAPRQGTSNDDTSEIQAAIDAAHAAGGGVVYLPVGTYNVSQIRLKSRVTLMGAGWGTRILHRTASTGHLLVLDTIGTEFTVVRDLMLHGNKSNQTGARDCLNYDNTNGTGFSFYDPCHVIENVLAYIPKNNGFTLSPNCRETKMVNCFSSGADNNGFLINATDSVYLGCTAAASGGTGISVGGPNSRLVGCKSYGSGRLNIAGNRHGFNITQKRMSFSSCEAQDNAEHGFMMAGLGDNSFNTFNGCIADSNGTNGFGQGFQITDTRDFSLNGYVAFDRQTTKNQRYGVSLSGSVSRFQISMTARDNVSGNIVGTPQFPYNMIINGEQFVSSANGTRYRLVVSDAGVLTPTTP